ncbi:MAG: hypothetical protein WCK90_02855 [archaeon]
MCCGKHISMSVGGGGLARSGLLPLSPQPSNAMQPIVPGRAAANYRGGAGASSSPYNAPQQSATYRVSVARGNYAPDSVANYGTIRAPSQGNPSMLYNAGASSSRVESFGRGTIYSAMLDVRLEEEVENENARHEWISRRMP